MDIKLVSAREYKKLTQPELFDLAEMAFHFQEDIRQASINPILGLFFVRPCTVLVDLFRRPSPLGKHVTLFVSVVDWAGHLSGVSKL